LRRLGEYLADDTQDSPPDARGPLWFAACADSNGSAAVAGSTLADRYPCDRGIAGDPAVVWAENFEEGSVAAVTARYDSHNNDAGMALVADRPPRAAARLR